MLIGSEITCVCFLDILHKIHIGGKGAPTEICPAEGGFPRTSDIKYTCPAEGGFPRTNHTAVATLLLSHLHGQ